MQYEWPPEPPLSPSHRISGSSEGRMADTVLLKASMLMSTRMADGEKNVELVL